MVVNSSPPDMPEDGDGNGLGATGEDVEVENDLQHAPMPERTRLIVGIGASAGGIDALKSFFSRMPCRCRLAFLRRSS